MALSRSPVRSRYAPITFIFKSDSMLKELFSQLTPVTQTENLGNSHLQEEINLKLSHVDANRTLEQSTQKELLKKGYRLMKMEDKGPLTICDQHSIFKTIYPAVFAEFEKSTNEKEMTKAYLSSILQKCIAKYPSFSFGDTFKIYDIGIGSGAITLELVKTSKKILPKSKKTFVYGVDKQLKFVKQSSKNLEDIADTVSIALGDLRKENLSYRLEGAPANHDELHDINFILLSHICYCVDSKTLQNTVLKQMIQMSSQRESPLFCFVHVSKDIPITKMFKTKEFDFLRPQRKDIQFIIRQALRLAKIPFYHSSFDTKFFFPILKESEWEKLSKTLLSFSKYDFQKELRLASTLPLKLQKTWKLIILWSRMTFAAMDPPQRKLILENFKKLTKQYPYGIPVSNTVIFASKDKKLLTTISSQ